VNGVHAELARAFEIERTIVDEHAFFRSALGDCGGQPEDLLLGLARMHVAGAEKDLKVAAQIEVLDAIVVQLEGSLLMAAMK